MSTYMTIYIAHTAHVNTDREWDNGITITSIRDYYVGCYQAGVLSQTIFVTNEDVK